MHGELKLEQIWGWRHEDKPEDPSQDPLLNYPNPRISEYKQINDILTPNPGAANVLLDNVEWLLLSTSVGKFKLFIRDYQEPQVPPPEASKIKSLYQSLLRYEPPDTGEIVWPLASIEDLDAMSDWYRQRWQNIAVLAVLQGGKLQVLCTAPYGEAGFCQAYCRPAPKSGYETLCSIYCPT